MIADTTPHPVGEPGPTMPAEAVAERRPDASPETAPAGKVSLNWLWLLLLLSLLLRLLWLDRPDGSLIFDEKYYVNASRMILGIPQDADVFQDRPLHLDPNTEHPPLAKLIVAGSIALLGDNPYGWRLPSVIFGTLGILLMYGIAAKIANDRGVALTAATLLAFDNLFFVHGRIFTLDISMLGFLLAGFYAYVVGRPTLAGLGFGLAALCKLGGLFGLFAVAAYEALWLVRGELPWRAALRPAVSRLVRSTAAFLVSFLLLLGIMDYLWVGFSQPLEHVERILGYGQLLRRQVPSGIESYPWQWLWNQEQIPYLKVEQQVRAGEEVRESRAAILFLGAMNPYVLTLMPFGLAFGAYAWWRRRPDAALGAFALAWFACNYLPFVAAYLIGQRISYLFYFLPCVPAIALAGSFFLLRGGLPALVRWTYLATVLLGFYGYFPFKPIA